jgi:predicted alpha-1,6-mannanase (GH76 family)
LRALRTVPVMSAERRRQLAFINGASVSIIWGSDNKGELQAEFQYDTQAHMFAKLLVADTTRPLSATIVVCNHYDGQVSLYRQEPAKDAT